MANNKTYVIHDNGGRPFKVVINKDVRQIELYRQYTTKNHDQRYELFETINGYQKVFVPKDPETGYDGNSILIQLSDNMYTYVGSEIYTFLTNDKIIKYYSPVGNSDVPYPYAIGTNNIYLTLERMYFDKKYARGVDPYGAYYGHKGFTKVPKEYVHSIDIQFIVHERLY